ncbi:PREDICTED: cuticle protein 7-like [Nicrophorus vespilloides]|uniref:Cuticle protein 7-like n=1 Tax=Nicrophorus vespilloides TaxID=110193 RepID=A0ABM1N3B2_NICVS|nr:PREDICTED: cuticle protein 7-like [Nicrophorus vespilloides]
MKYIIAFAILASAAYAQIGDYGHHKHLEEYKDFQSHPHYNYHYGVHDQHTHDVKDQWEAREGHNTKGSYSFLQPDGRKRIVEYHADKHGIHYNVKFEGHAKHEEGKRGYEVHGKSSSQQYAHAETNYHGPTHHGGGGGGGGY